MSPKSKYIAAQFLSISSKLKQAASQSTGFSFGPCIVIGFLTTSTVPLLDYCDCIITRCQKLTGYIQATGMYY